MSTTNYIFKIDHEELQAIAGTKLFLQDGMYFYKTITEQEQWLSRQIVENNPHVFRRQTALEFFFHTNQIIKDATEER